jgi:hypothetical protein
MTESEGPVIDNLVDVVDQMRVLKASGEALDSEPAIAVVRRARGQLAHLLLALDRVLKDELVGEARAELLRRAKGSDL